MVISIAEIAEGDARGEVAALYADIREVTGEPSVNLIYRHLATTPPTLAWAWQRLRPLFADGFLQLAGRQVEDAMADVRPQSPVIPADALGGLTASDLDDVRTVLRFYLRANPRNLVALAVLDAVLRGNVKEAGDSGTWPVPGSLRHSRVDAPLPLPSLAELRPAVRNDVDAVAELLASGTNDMPMPSVVRHLAYWPAVLSQWRSMLGDPATRRHGQQAAAVMAERSIQLGYALAVVLDPSLRTPPSAGSQRRRIGDTVDAFRRLLPPVTGAVAALSARVG